MSDDIIPSKLTKRKASLDLSFLDNDLEQQQQQQQQQQQADERTTASLSLQDCQLSTLDYPYPDHLVRLCDSLLAESAQRSDPQQQPTTTGKIHVTFLNNPSHIWPDGRRSVFTYVFK